MPGIWLKDDSQLDQARALIEEYTALVYQMIGRLSADNHSIAIAIADVPSKIRGYGHVKEAHLAKAKAEEVARLTQATTPPTDRQELPTLSQGN